MRHYGPIEFSPPRVTPYNWHEHGETLPVLKIQVGGRFILVEYSNAYALVNRIHDLCEEHESTHGPETHQ